MSPHFLKDIILYYYTTVKYIVYNIMYPLFIFKI